MRIFSHRVKKDLEVGSLVNNYELCAYSISIQKIMTLQISASDQEAITIETIYRFISIMQEKVKDGHHYEHLT